MEEKKKKLFEKMLKYENLARHYENKGEDRLAHDANMVGEGIFEALESLGWSYDYIHWSVGK